MNLKYETNKNVTTVLPKNEIFLYNYKMEKIVCGKFDNIIDFKYLLKNKKKELELVQRILIK